MIIKMIKLMMKILPCVGVLVYFVNSYTTVFCRMCCSLKHNLKKNLSFLLLSDWILKSESIEFWRLKRILRHFVLWAAASSVTLQHLRHG